LAKSKTSLTACIHHCVHLNCVRQCTVYLTRFNHRVGLHVCCSDSATAGQVASMRFDSSTLEITSHRAETKKNGEVLFYAGSIRFCHHRAYRVCPILVAVGTLIPYRDTKYPKTREMYSSSEQCKSESNPIHSAVGKVCWQIPLSLGIVYRSK
jgi:hypothetical protein